jgi:prepilin-type N-terminal cleavage/methylation domain-containing protein
MKLSSFKLNPPPRRLLCSSEGFTLTELLVVIIIAGVLAGIAAPSWLAFVDRQRLTTVRSELVLKIKEAQAKALRTKTLQSVRVDFPNPGRPTVYLVRAKRDPEDPTKAITYESDGPGKVLGGENNNSFTLDIIGQSSRLTFDYNGAVVEPKAKMGSLVSQSYNQEAFLMYRLKPRAGSSSLACVTVDTIVGAITESSDDKCK